MLRLIPDQPPVASPVPPCHPCLPLTPAALGQPPSPPQRVRPTFTSLSPRNVELTSVLLSADSTSIFFSPFAVTNGNHHSPPTLNAVPSPPQRYSNGPSSSSSSSLANQQLPATCGARQLSKLKRFLTTLQQFGNDISPEIGDNVRSLVLALVVGALLLAIVWHFDQCCGFCVDKCILPPRIQR